MNVLCPCCLCDGLEFLDIKIVEYDEFFDETYASFKAYCRLCGWKK